MPLLQKLLRRTFYTTAALSTLLLMAALILWPLSHYRNLYARYVMTDAGYWLNADSGRVYVGCSLGFNTSPAWRLSSSDPAWHRWSYLTWNAPEPQADPSAHTFLGVCWFNVEPRSSATCLVPFSYLALLFSLLPFLAFRSIRRQRKLARTGLCPKCHYDLRAHTPNSRCPECGTVVKT